jgi:hypothetical protein
VLDRLENLSLHLVVNEPGIGVLRAGTGLRN